MKQIFSFSAGKIVVVTICALAVLFTIPYSFRKTIEAPVDAATLFSQRLASGFRSAFNFTPKIFVDQTVVVEEKIPIAELALIKKSEMVEYSWSHTWLGSTKKISLKGVFDAKAGFDLKENFSLRINSRTKEVETKFPEAKLLSIEMKKFSFEADENGIWNKISKQDRENAIRALQRIAKEKILASDILNETKISANEQVNKIISESGLLSAL